MSLGGNISSGHTNTLIDTAIQCGINKKSNIVYSDNCCDSGNSIKQPISRYPSMVLQGRQCPDLTPAQVFQLPKVATSSSVRTQALTSISSTGAISPPYAILPTSQDRFSMYQRFKAPIQCPPVLLPSAYMAGKSLPSFSRPCNL